MIPVHLIITRVVAGKVVWLFLVMVRNEDLKKLLEGPGSSARGWSHWPGTQDYTVSMRRCFEESRGHSLPWRNSLSIGENVQGNSWSSGIKNSYHIAKAAIGVHGKTPWTCRFLIIVSGVIMKDTIVLLFHVPGSSRWGLSKGSITQVSDTTQEQGGRRVSSWGHENRCASQK